MRLEAGNLLYLDSGEKIDGRTSQGPYHIEGPAGPFRIHEYHPDPATGLFLFALQGDGDKWIEVTSPTESILDAVK